MTTPDRTSSPTSFIPFRGMVTAAEFARIQRLVTPWWASWPITALLILLTCVYLEGWIVGILLAVPITVAVCGFVVLIGRLQGRRHAALQQEISGVISDVGVGWNTTMTTANYPWSKIVKIRQHSDMLLLFYSGRCAFYMPKHFFATEATWDDAFALALRCQSDAKG